MALQIHIHLIVLLISTNYYLLFLAFHICVYMSVVYV